MAENVDLTRQRPKLLFPLETVTRRELLEFFDLIKDLLLELNISGVFRDKIKDTRKELIKKLNGNE